ncbi:SpaH/EbpB family LPXTG-anchored major pilin [Holdemanella porci]|uniref:SpaH/EbpB family LPXTG-anchored major pilin n=1 Tax=Holdemanella porci TaxID=2652276 RepID=UPI003AF13DF4
MKLIKKIAAIMFAFMMVVSMSCNVKAEDTEGVYGQKDGSITITGALQGQTYTIYEMLKLESFSGTNYSYKIADGWENFFKEGAEGAAYMKKDENGYMSFIAGKDGEADRREFAQKALAYAKKTTGINTKSESTKVNESTVNFTGLNLGYYLVGSTTGSLCGLDTTHKTVEIKEKNGVPTVEKTIEHGGKIDSNKQSNSANIGESIAFETKINVSNGAKKYVLHDKMDSNLKLFIPTVEETGPVHITANKSTVNPVYNTDYFVDTNISDSCKCTFHVRFSEEYLNKIDDTVVLTCHYYATLSDNAEINKEMVNQTWLTYGDNNKESNRSETKTYTFGIPVLKYTGDVSKPLAGAKFKLYTDSNCNEESTALKFNLNNNNKYRYDSTNGKTVLTSFETTGRIDIEGLEAGTYYLKEIEAPKGYNLLKNPVTIKIDSEGKIFVNNSTTENTGDVKVENKTGTVLPSTGGAGTTMIYLVGALLVLGSGVVLATKRRVKNK